MLREIFTSQRRFINSFFDHVDVAEAEKVLSQMAICKGVIVLTGVGKSGIIAEKIAKTLISTGTKAMYLSPMSALHGDIGALAREDLFIILSKSGKSLEVLELASAVQARSIPVISWISTRNAPLEKFSNFVMHLPVEREICPFDLAPTTSTEVQLIFGDAMGAALMKMKRFSIEQYACNHPAGAIGLRISQKVRDVMVRGDDLPLCHADDKLKEVLFELSRKRLGCLLVVDAGKKLLGIFTDGDLRRGIETGGSSVLDKTMKELMIKKPLYTTPDTLTSKAVETMEMGERRVMMLPVLDRDTLVGLVHLHDILTLKFRDYANTGGA